MSSLIYYYIPEDHEDQEKLNAFIIYKEMDSLRLNDIVDNFPIPGQYYFRFKFKFDNKNVWIDFNNTEAKLPRFENKIIIKVSRISWGKEGNADGVPSSFPDLI
jgi:hypothetical protein